MRPLALPPAGGRALRDILERPATPRSKNFYPVSHIPRPRRPWARRATLSLCLQGTCPIRPPQRYSIWTADSVSTKT